MRRMILSVAVVLVMGAVMAAGALPAFGVANRHASCQGAGHSNQLVPGAAGEFHRTLATMHRNGEIARFYARLAPQGRYRDTHGDVAPDSQGCGFPE